MADFEHILWEKRGQVGILTINRPEKMNAIAPQTSHEMHQAWEDFRTDDNLRVAILIGAGERAFSAGNDLVAMAQAGGGAIHGAVTAPFGGFTKRWECWKPIIGAINGYCLAGGMEMALACDIRIAAEHATFGQPEVQRAIIPGAGGCVRLPRYIPMAYAAEILLVGDRIDAETALRAGIVSRVVPKQKLMETALAMAEAICKRGPVAVRYSKEVMYRSLDMSMPAAFAFEDRMEQLVLHTDDAKEGPRAFAEKREPQYKGR